MVKDENEHSEKIHAKQGCRADRTEPYKIGVATPFDFGAKNLTPYGGLFPVATMLEKLGFQKKWEWGDPTDFACVARDQVELFLSLSTKATLPSWISIFVQDVDALHATYQATGAIVREPPADYPWGMREMTVEGQQFEAMLDALGGNPKVVRWNGPSAYAEILPDSSVDRTCNSRDFVDNDSLRRKDLAQHYSVLANYVYGKSIDVATENQLQDEPQDYLQPQLDRAVSDNDVRHRLVLTLLAESPQTWAAPLRNFQFSMLNTLQSSQYYSILAGSDINGDGFPFNDRVGDIGRNTYRGAPYYDTDLRLQRLFNLTERWKVNASAEALNVLNRVNVQDVDQVYGAGEFAGPVPRSFGDGVTSPANPTFGTPTFAGAARQIQLSVKVKF